MTIFVFKTFVIPLLMFLDNLMDGIDTIASRIEAAFGLEVSAPAWELYQWDQLQKTLNAKAKYTPQEVIRYIMES